MPGSLTTPGRPGARDDAPRRIAFHDLHGVGTQNRNLSRLNGWPMRSPVNASPKPSRATAHDSGPMWIATPSSQGTCTLYSLPVSRRLAYIFRFALKLGHGSMQSACLKGANRRHCWLFSEAVARERCDVSMENPFEIGDRLM